MKKIIYQAIGISFVALFILSACGGQATPTPTPAPSSTPTPIPLPSETPAPTEKPLKALADQAKTLCDSAADAPIVGGYIQSPGLVMLKTSYDETSDWKLLNLADQPGGGFAKIADDVQGLFCVLQTRVKEDGFYTDGSDAYTIVWDIVALSWPDGKMLGRINLPGGDPPETKTYAGPGYGDPPQDDFVQIVADAHAGTPTLFTDSHCASISSDGKRMLAGGSRADNTKLSLWDLATMQTLWVREERAISLQCSLAISPDGSRGLFRPSFAGELLDLDSQDQLATFEGAGLHTLFLPDGKTMFVIGISKKSIVSTLDPQIVDANTGKVIAQFPKTHQSLVNSLSLSQDASLLLTSSGDGKIVLWDVQARKVKTIIDSKIPFLSKAVLSSDGSLIAASKSIWDAASGEVVATPPPGLFNPMAFVPGKHALLYTNENEDRALSLWDMDSGETKTIFKYSFDPIAFDMQNGFVYLYGTGGMLLKIPFSP